MAGLALRSMVVLLQPCSNHPVIAATFQCVIAMIYRYLGLI